MSHEHQEVYERQAELCKALAHPVRLQILDLLGTGQMSNAQLLTALKIPKANLSQHLGILEKAGIVAFQREGTSLCVFLAIPEIKDACAMVRKLLLKLIHEEQQQVLNVREKVMKVSRRID